MIGVGGEIETNGKKEAISNIIGIEFSLLSPFG